MCVFRQLPQRKRPRWCVTDSLIACGRPCWVVVKTRWMSRWVHGTVRVVVHPQGLVHPCLDLLLPCRRLMAGSRSRSRYTQVMEARRTAARLRRKVEESNRALEKVHKLDEAARRRLVRKQQKLEHLRNLLDGGENRCEPVVGGWATCRWRVCAVCVHHACVSLVLAGQGVGVPVGALGRGASESVQWVAVSPPCGQQRTICSVAIGILSCGVGQVTLSLPIQHITHPRTRSC